MTPTTSNKLDDHFSRSKTWDMQAQYNITTVMEAQKLTDKQILDCRGAGRIFLRDLRNLHVTGQKESPFTKHTSRCIQKAGEEEPLFVLRGADISSPRLVLLWMAENEGSISDEKMRAAFDCVMEMRNFPGRKRAS